MSRHSQERTQPARSHAVSTRWDFALCDSAPDCRRPTGRAGYAAAVPITPRLTPAASAHLERLRSEGHSIHWGRGSDGRSAFYWARVTPRSTATERNVRAADGDGLVTKVSGIIAADPSSHVVAALSDPLRSCPLCGAEPSFDPDGPSVLTCPKAGTEPGHLEVTPL